jgi:HEAT repeat protein
MDIRKALKTFYPFLISLCLSLAILSGASGVQEPASKETARPLKTPARDPGRAGKTPPVSAEKAVQNKTASDPKKAEKAAPKSPVPPKTAEKAAAADNKADIGKDAKQMTAEEKRKQRDADREKKDIEWIERTLDLGIQRERIDAMVKMLTIKDQAKKRELGLRLRDIIRDEIDSEVRTKAIYVAGEIGMKDLAPEITGNLINDVEDVKIAAVYALKKINETGASEKMIDILKKQDLKKNSNFTEALITTLGSFKAVQLKDYAIEAIKNEHNSTNNREHLVMFLGKAGVADSKEFLVGLLKNDDEETVIRAYACNSLARLNARDAGKEIDDVIQKIESYPYKKRQNYHRLYIQAIGALAKLGDERAFPRLVNSVRSNNDSVRIQAIRLLKEIKNERTIDILKHKMKYDPSSKVQKEAKKALEELGVKAEENRDKNGEKEKSPPESPKAEPPAPGRTNLQQQAK